MTKVKTTTTKKLLTKPVSVKSKTSKKTTPTSKRTVSQRGALGATSGY